VSSPGPVADELGQLTVVLERWLRERGGPAVSAVAQAFSGLTGWLEEQVAGAHIGGSQECTACPLCAGLATVRASSPQAYEHLAGAGGSLVAAVRAVIDADPQPAPRPPAERITVTG